MSNAEEMSGAVGDETSSLSTQSLEMMVQMKKDQRARLEGHPKGRKELMQQNQQAQRELVDTFKAPPTCLPVGSARAAAKSPKPTFKKSSAIISRPTLTCLRG